MTVRGGLAFAGALSTVYERVTPFYSVVLGIEPRRWLQTIEKMERETGLEPV